MSKRPLKTPFKENTEKPKAGLKPISGDNPSFSDWKAIFNAVLTCTDPSPKAMETINAGKAGQSYIHAQSLREQNPAFFNALSSVVGRSVDFEIRLNEKMIVLGDEEDAERRKKNFLNRPLGKITFRDLCDGEQFAMRGRVRELVTSFKDAMASAGDSLTKSEKTQIASFVKTVETLSKPVDFTARRSRSPERAVA